MIARLAACRVHQKMVNSCRRARYSGYLIVSTGYSIADQLLSLFINCKTHRDLIMLIVQQVDVVARNTFFTADQAARIYEK